MFEKEKEISFETLIEKASGRRVRKAIEDPYLPAPDESEYLVKVSKDTFETLLKKHDLRHAIKEDEYKINTNLLKDMYFAICTQDVAFLQIRLEYYQADWKNGVFGQTPFKVKYVTKRNDFYGAYDSIVYWQEDFWGDKHTMVRHVHSAIILQPYSVCAHYHLWGGGAWEYKKEYEWEVLCLPEIPEELRQV